MGFSSGFRPVCVSRGERSLRHRRWEEVFILQPDHLKASLPQLEADVQPYFQARLRLI